MKRCPRCPRLIPTTARYCPECQRGYDAERGTAEQRGYGRDHRRLRAFYARRMAAGATYSCAKCGELVTVAHKWDLGHNDDRTAWTGPEHADECNRADGGRRSRG